MSIDWKINTTGSAAFGPFINAANGTGYVTGLGTPTGYIIKDDYAAEFIPDNWNEKSLGWYRGGFSAGDFNVYGDAVVLFHDPSSYLAVWERFNVISSTAYKEKYGTGPCKADLYSISGSNDVDGVNMGVAFERLLSFTSGKWYLNATGDELTLYKQDNATELVKFSLSATARNRE